MILHIILFIFLSGVEDQFSKSQYGFANRQDIVGLAEYRTPGAYTPRKQLHNPSADPNLVLHWTTGVDINNRAAPPSNQQTLRSSLGRSHSEQAMQNHFMNTSQNIKARLSAPTRPW